MKSKFTLAVALCAALFLGACASHGNQFLKEETADTVKSKLVDGVTTKDEVAAAFGPAQNISFTDGGKEIWTYKLQDMKNDPVNFVPLVNLFGSSYSGHETTLVIIFENDKVLKHSFSRSEVQTKTGVFK